MLQDRCQPFASRSAVLQRDRPTDRPNLRPQPPRKITREVSESYHTPGKTDASSRAACQWNADVPTTRNAVLGAHQATASGWSSKACSSSSQFSVVHFASLIRSGGSKGGPSAELQQREIRIL